MKKFKIVKEFYTKFLSGKFATFVENIDNSDLVYHADKENNETLIYNNILNCYVDWIGYHIFNLPPYYLDEIKQSWVIKYVNPNLETLVFNDGETYTDLKKCQSTAVSLNQKFNHLMYFYFPAKLDKQ